MEIDQDAINSLVANPSESLSVEVKSWLDPTTPSGQGKIVRACLALYNRNGGFLLMGFDDTTLQPDAVGQLANVRSAFHVDDIQWLISKYAYELFEVGIGFSERAGVEHPVVVVPSGVTSPVAAKKKLVDGSGKTLVDVGEVYFRTLNASGVPSTSVAKPADWRDIAQICFDNREADIGRFLRRQLSSLDSRGLAEVLRHIGLATTLQPQSAEPSLREVAISVLDKGEQRFQLALDKRNLKEAAKRAAEGIAWQTALVLDPRLSNRVADAVFLNELLGSNPRYTGWPVWVDSRTFSDTANRPVRTADAWEALIASIGGWSSHLDFMRFEPDGRFYLRRALQDDLSDQVEPGTVLDPLLVILRVAEAIAVGLAMIGSLTKAETREESVIGFAFRWSKLSGRVLTTWANPLMTMMGASMAHEDEISTFVEVPAGTPTLSIAPFVDEATRELFALFDGERIAYNVIEDWTTKLLERRLR